jgi:pimeloyl-ACP methyl ester carboxylesterase
MVGLQLALKYPNLVDKMMVFNTSAYTNKSLQDIGRLWEKAAGSYDADTYYNEFAPMLYSPEYYQTHHDAIYARKEMIRPFVTKEYCDSIIRLSQSSVGFDIRDQLSKIHHPTLIVGSEVDYLTPLADQKYLSEHLPNSELIVIPNAGHGVIFEKVVLLTVLIVGWFRDLDTRMVFEKDKH